MLAHASEAELHKSLRAVERQAEAPSTGRRAALAFLETLPPDDQNRVVVTAYIEGLEELRSAALGELQRLIHTAEQGEVNYAG